MLDCSSNLFSPCLLSELSLPNADMNTTCGHDDAPVDEAGPELPVASTFVGTPIFVPTDTSQSLGNKGYLTVISTTEVSYSSYRTWLRHSRRCSSKREADAMNCTDKLKFYRNQLQQLTGSTLDNGRFCYDFNDAGNIFHAVLDPCADINGSAGLWSGGRR